MFHKTSKFFKLAKLQRKQQPKRDLLRLLPFLLIELAFVIELAFQNLISSSFGVLVFTVDIHFEWLNLFWVMKKQLKLY